MKTIFKISLILFVSVNLYAKDEINKNDLESIKSFMVGNYQLIGKKLNSNKSYMGRIEIKFDHEQLIFNKSIDKKSYKGTADIELTQHDLVKVLRLRYKDKDKNIEETCLFHSDLDNYARISCHFYEKDQPTDSPGLEAFFIHHQD